MKTTFKKLLNFPITLIAIFLTLQSFAQPRGMTMSQVNHIVDHQMRQANNRFNSNVSVGIGLSWGPGKGDRYRVTFKDSSVKEVTSFMYTDTISHKSFLVFEDKKFPKSDTLNRNQKIYVGQTLYISTIIDRDAGTEAYGVPNDSCWAFKVIDGGISVYAKSMQYLFVPENSIESEFDMYEIVGIQLKDGPIVKLTDDNLKQMVGQDKNALEALEKKKYYKAIKKYNRHTDKAD